MRKMRFVLVILIVLVSNALHASLIIPPRLVVKSLVQAVNEKSEARIGWYFKFNHTEHQHLTPLTRAEQLDLLRNIKTNEMLFEKDDYFIDRAGIFTVRLIEPKNIEFVMRWTPKPTEWRKGPPGEYDIIAIRK